MFWNRFLRCKKKEKERGNRRCKKKKLRFLRFFGYAVGHLRIVKMFTATYERLKILFCGFHFAVYGNNLEDVVVCQLTKCQISDLIDWKKQCRCRLKLRREFSTRMENLSTPQSGQILTRG